ncbi:MAG: DsbC family protein [Spongiibacteraceae bacterium]
MTLLPRFFAIIFTVLFSVASTFSVAQPVLTAEAIEKPKASPAVESAIRASFKASRPELGIASIEPSDINGLYAVQVSNGPVLYVTADGNHFVLGDLYAVAPGGFINLAERKREGDRAELMAQVKSKDMIIFSPKQQPAKATVMVFTDVDCFYCQKLHQEVPDLNRMGIEVRYLAYPRAGIGSDSYKKIASAWCAADKQTALTTLKNRGKIAMKVCTPNPVAEQLALGQSVGVNGTPALITSDGRLMPGYMPALQLAAALGVAVDPVIVAELQTAQVP